jgi:hypothetical protein
MYVKDRYPALLEKKMQHSLLAWVKPMQGAGNTSSIAEIIMSASQQ